MKPGHGEVLIAEGDVDVAEDEQALIEEFRRQLDEGMWAAVPVTGTEGTRREARMVHSYEEIPSGAERVIFFPRAVCPRCLGTDLDWQRLSGRGTLHTFTVVHRGLRDFPLGLPAARQREVRLTGPSGSQAVCRR